MAGTSPALCFVDKNDLAVGRAMAAVKAPVFPGHTGLPEVPLGTDDEDWIPIVAGYGLVTSISPGLLVSCPLRGRDRRRPG
jgi:hypothetical protein